MEFKIGDVLIPNQFILAPMAGVCNEAFRLICKEQGAGLLMAEMVSDKAIVYNNKKTIKMTYVNELEHPISMQIFGSDVESMVLAAIFVDKNTDADIIDINMGCPVNKVAKKSGAGASLLRNPSLIYDIVSNVVKSVSKPVTVKIRIGWDHDSINAVEVAKLIENAGAKAITVHGRTRSDFYNCKANYDVIKQVVEAVNIPVIGNGDVIDIASAKRMFETGCKAIAIGRGSLGNPFIFRELVNYFDYNKETPKVTNEEIYNTIVKQHKLLLDLKGEKLANLEMRSHIAWYLKGRPNSAKIKDIIFKQDSFIEVEKIIKDYLLIN